MNHIDDLLQKRVIEKTNEIGIISPIFFVPKSDGSCRLILNLKELNQNIEYRHFKMQSLKDALALINPGDFMAKLDLKSAYDSVPVNTGHRKYLQFSVLGTVYQYRGWPNGLCEAPRLFTKILKPVLAIFGKLSMRVVMFLDDLLIINSKPLGLVQDVENAKYLLTSLGFLLNDKKSVVNPSNCIEFLGICLDSKSMTAYIPERKVSNILNLIDNSLNSKFISATSLASLLGKFQAACVAILPAPLHYRALQNQLIQAVRDGNWEIKVVLNVQSQIELNWWKKNLRRANGRSFALKHPDIEIKTDASKKGWGAVSGFRKAQGRWTNQEICFQINILELMAIQRGLLALCKEMSGKLIKIKSDNITALAYVRKMGGTKSSHMNKLAKEIWDWCLERKCQIQTQFLPGMENIQADSLSRNFKDSSDWMLNPEIFQKIQRKWGPMNVDLFASMWNHQLKRYYSWGNQPDAEGQDALQVSWKNMKAYAFPPFILINKILQKLVWEKATIILITPFWRTANWYGRLVSLSIDHPILLPRTQDLILGPLKEIHPLVKENKLQMIAWKLSGDPYQIKEFLQRSQKLLQGDTGKIQKCLMGMHGESGAAGVNREILLNFTHL